MNNNLNNFLFRIPSILCVFLLLLSNAAWAADSDGESKLWEAIDGQITIVSPSHGDVSIVESNGVRINFEVLISTDSPIRLLEVTRNEGSNVEASKITEETKRQRIVLVHRRYLSSTSWYAAFTFMKELNEEKINVRVISKKRSRSKEFIIRSCCKYVSDDEDILKPPHSVDRLKRTHFLPVSIGIKSYDNITKANDEERKISGVSQLIDVAYMGNTDFGNHAVRWTGLSFSRNSFSSVQHNNEDTSNTYQYHELMIFSAGGGLLSKWSGMLESDFQAFYNIIQTAYGEGSGETNTDFKLSVGNNLTGDKVGLSFGGAYGSTAVTANLGTNTNSDYDNSGSITGIKLFVSYDFNFGFLEDLSFEAGADMDNKSYATSGKYMQYEEAGIYAWIGCYWEHVDLIIKNSISLNENYAQARPSDSQAIANTRSLTSIGGKIRLSRDLRLFFSLDMDSQKSNIQDFTYQETTFSISLGWTG